MVKLTNYTGEFSKATEFVTLVTATKLGQLAIFELSLLPPTPKTNNLWAVARVKKRGYSGKETVDVNPIEGVNVGKANETDSYTQASRQLNTWVNKALDKGYKRISDLVPWDGPHYLVGNPTQQEDILRLLGPKNTDASGRVKPMLAQEYSGDPSALELPLLAQPKLDGVRCFATITKRRETKPGSSKKVSRWTVEFTSRNGKTFTTLNHLVEPCIELGKKHGTSIILDGELFIEGPGFQTIISSLKRYQADQTPNIQLRVFDIASSELQEQRYKLMKSLIPKSGIGGVVRVRTWVVKDSARVSKLFYKCKSKGYEGLMLRALQAPYEFGRRSKSLLKYKEFLEDEFVITGVYEGTGRAKGTAILEMAISEKLSFTSSVMGDLSQRKQLWKDRASLIGKIATVKFQTLTDAGKPLFPSVKCIRDYE